MTKGEAIKQTVRLFFVKVFLPTGLAGLALGLGYVLAASWSKQPLLDFGLLFLVVAGFPYGFRLVRTWSFVHGSGVSIAEMLGHIVLQLILAGLIGVPVLAWRILTAVYYIIRVIINIFLIAAGKEYAVYIADQNRNATVS